MNDPRWQKTDKEWQRLLTPEQYRVTRQKGTEPPFSGKYDTVFQDGVYHCSNCGSALFHSKDKFDAGCGWPSFSQVGDPKNIEEIPDISHGMHRTEVICHTCGAHLGHVFPDGPTPTGLRYCINSVALHLVPSEDGE